MNISFTGFLLGLVLVAIPIYVIFTYRLPLIRRFLLALFRLFVFTGIVAAAMYYVLTWPSVGIDILACVLLVIFSAVFTVGRARLLQAKMVVPVTFGVLVPVFLVSAYLYFVVFRPSAAFDSRLLIPLVGLTSGSVIGANAHALHTYYMGLEHHNQLYYYLLGNGATHREAVNYFVRRSLEANLVPCLGQMAYVVVAYCPVVFWISLMHGSDVFSAFSLQVLLAIAIMAVACTSLLLTLLLARRYSFDEYEKLKPVAPSPAPKQAPTEEEPMPEETTYEPEESTSESEEPSTEE
jgi:putative ABC transport system permease protein